MLGFSMGGSVSVRLGVDPSVCAVLGLAPWLPEQLDLSPLEGKRLAIVHGTPRRATAGHPGRDGQELASRVRARRLAGNRRVVHARARRASRDGRPLSLGTNRVPAPCPGVARCGRRRARALRGGRPVMDRDRTMYTIVETILRPILMFVYRVRITGREHVPESGPVRAGRQPRVGDGRLLPRHRRHETGPVHGEGGAPPACRSSSRSSKAPARSPSSAARTRAGQSPPR